MQVAIIHPTLTAAELAPDPDTAIARLQELQSATGIYAGRTKVLPEPLALEERISDYATRVSRAGRPVGSLRSGGRGRPVLYEPFDARDW